MKKESKPTHWKKKYGHSWGETAFQISRQGRPRMSKRLIRVETVTVAVKPVVSLTDRNLALCEMYKAGNSLRDCGQQFKISRERVFQILKKYDVALRNGAPVEMPAVMPDDNNEAPVQLDRFEAEVLRSRTKRKFQALSDEAQAAVRILFKRHLQACESLNVPVDIQWLPDCVFEVARMAKLRERDGGAEHE